VCNLRNDVTTIESFIDQLTSVEPSADVSCSGDELPFPSDYSDAGLREILGTVPHTPMPQAIDEDLALYRQLVADKAIDLAQLDV